MAPRIRLRLRPGDAAATPSRNEAVADEASSLAEAFPHLKVETEDGNVATPFVKHPNVKTIRLKCHYRKVHDNGGDDDGARDEMRDNGTYQDGTHNGTHNGTYNGTHNGTHNGTDNGTYQDGNHNGMQDPGQGDILDSLEDEEGMGSHITGEQHEEPAEHDPDCGMDVEPTTSVAQVIETLEQATSATWDTSREAVLASLRALDPNAADTEHHFSADRPSDRLSLSIQSVEDLVAKVPQAAWRDYRRKLRQLFQSPGIRRLSYEARMRHISRIVFLGEESAGLATGDWARIENGATLAALLAAGTDEVGRPHDVCWERQWLRQKIRNARWLRQLHEARDRVDRACEEA